MTSTGGMIRVPESIISAFREEGVALLPQLLDDAALARCRAFFNCTKEKSKTGRNIMHNVFNDVPSQGVEGYEECRSEAQAFFKDLPIFAQVSAQVWGSKNVWYKDEELLWKFGGHGFATGFHQDTSYNGQSGEHCINFWFCFEDFTPQRSALKVVRGSHKGPIYVAPWTKASLRKMNKIRDGCVTLPDGRNVPWEFPSLPDIKKEQGKYDIWSSGTKKGDVIIFHPNCIHGGGFVDAEHPERTTLVLRFFGDDCTFHAMPTDFFDPRLEGLQDGDHFSKSFDWIRISGPGLDDATTSHLAKL